MEDPKMSDLLKFMEDASHALPSELWLVGNVIVRQRPGESLEEAVRREVNDAPKRHAIIRDLKVGE
jgi:hypothetical protein